MENRIASAELLNLLNKAIARELQVSIQYMFQHSIGASKGASTSGKTLSAKRNKFVASHSPVWLPGTTLKKIAITEMRHAEAIVERVAGLGGEPTTQPDAITIGETAEEMLEIDKGQEREAIQLYGQIINLAESEQDDVTKNLFQRILSDEEEHHRVFSNMLGVD
jgi:bacterioferritin